MADRVDLDAVQDQLTTVQGRLKAHYFADPGDCVWAVEQVAVLLAEVRDLREVVEAVPVSVQEDLRAMAEAFDRYWAALVAGGSCRDRSS